jgi:hypothetical protein
VFAAEAVGEPSRQVVGARLGNAERDDEREDCGAGRDRELLLRDGRQDAALEADHAAHESIDENQ